MFFVFFFLGTNLNNLFGNQRFFHVFGAIQKHGFQIKNKTNTNTYLI